ncbi:MAG: RusA family crossover junction endodeoxyribonuclease [Nitrospira sp.]|nr:RusA family crossover junction endodeoxyribonuclease [Nitrospira sp.]MDI3462074.1 Endodeoxyribonuclease RusA [Nitrospira sp.]
MPSDRRRYNYRSSRFHLSATSYRGDPIFPSAPNRLRRINGTTLSPTPDSSNSTAALRTPLQPPIATSDAFTITLPIPPSINHQYATVNGRRLLSAAGRAYKTYVGRQVWLALAQSPARCSLRDRLHSGPLALTIRFFFASALRRDLDGGLKIAQDAICEGLGLNDNRIIETHLYKQVDKADPRMEVSLRCLHPPHHSA